MEKANVRVGKGENSEWEMANSEDGSEFIICKRL